MPRSLIKWEGGALPSHLTKAQASRLLGVNRSAVWQRCESGTLPVVPVLGVPMIPTAAVLQLMQQTSPLALPPGEVLALVESAALAIVEARGEAPVFSSLELAGVYLGLSRLPWPPPSPEVPNA